MTTNSTPLPATSYHDEHGNHTPPYMTEWRNAADPQHPAYDPNRVVRGTEVSRFEGKKALFAEHLEEHRRKGEPAIVVEEIEA